ncbi:SDR family NAD(P)-dependent oxidoreductase, partial [Streptomyces hygroscopicus]|uniref:SDR family NAD(P)-dependent oxidoreductase n=1 Tax=Streptomyces hygroscopicus TaxID=1912 RepID=UPI0036899F9D
MGQLEGKTAVVTGGSTGIGLAAAVRMAAEGAHVFITGRRKAELDAAVEAIGPAGATAVAGDISDLADLDRLYDAVRARGRGLDVVLGGAGGGGGGGPGGGAARTTRPAPSPEAAGGAGQPETDR